MTHSRTMAENDSLLINLVHSCTNLTEDDIKTLLEVSHSLPAVGNLEGGDTYINILTKRGESMVIAQYRHPYSDLYKRDIVGEVVKKEDEPAVYRALEYGLSGRGMVGIIDAGKIMVRHTVSPILNSQKMVIGALTYEYPNLHAADTDPMRIRPLPPHRGIDESDEKINLVAGYMQDGLLVFDEDGICTFANAKAEELYHGVGCTGSVVGRRYEDLKIATVPREEVIAQTGVIKNEARIGNYIFEESLSAIWEDGSCTGIAVVLQDKTQIRRMEDEISFRIASINEVHHRVKNNLQTIISLIGLEALQTNNEEVKAFSKTIASRIRSISVTHDLLAHTGTDAVNLKTMLARVIDGSLETCSAGGCRVSTDVSGDDLEVMASTASTIALIVNELIQNSMKYAFTGCESGKICVDVRVDEEYSWITVQDNGCGFDERTVKKLSSGLGLKLVDSLVKSSLKGEITVESSNQGTATRFSFHTPVQKRDALKIF